MTKSALPVGLLGISCETIENGKKGWCWFPVGEYDPELRRKKWVRCEVHAIEDIRANRDVIIADDQEGCKEHTPAELSYQTLAGPYQRVTEAYPLPVTEAAVYSGYLEETTSATEEEWEVQTDEGTEFESKSTMIYCTQAVYIRFNSATDTQLKLNAGVYYTFKRRATKIYYQQVTAAGTLQVWAEG